MRRRLPRSGVLAGCAAAALGLPSAAHGQSAQWAIQTSASAGVETNPYSTQRDTGTAFTGTLDVQPYIVVDRPLTTMQLSGDAQAAFYSNGIPTTVNVSLNGSGQHRLSEHTSFSAQVGFTDDIAGGVFGGVVPFVAPVVATVTPPANGAASAADAVAAPTTTVTLPLNGLPTYLNDPSLGAIGLRRQSYQLGAFVATTISARDSISGGTTASLIRYGGGAQEYNYVAPSVSWQRALGEHFSLGAGFQAGFIHYLHSAFGDSTTYGPQLTATRGFGRGWTASGSVGLTFADVQNFTGGSRTTQSFSGSLNLCQQSGRRNLCVFASRQVAPSAFEGVTTSTLVSGTFSYQLSELGGIQFAGSYSHADGSLVRDLPGQFDDQIDYANVSGSYSRRLGRALSGFISAGYAQAFGNRLGRDGANVTAQVGVSYRFARRP